MLLRVFHAHLDTCVLLNGHIAFQLFESPQAWEGEWRRQRSQLTEGLRNNLIKKIPVLLFISVFRLSVFPLALL